MSDRDRVGPDGTVGSDNPYRIPHAHVDDVGPQAEDYAALIAATPNVRYRASLPLQIGVLAIVAGLIAVIVLPAVMR